MLQNKYLPFVISSADLRPYNSFYSGPTIPSSPSTYLSYPLICLRYSHLCHPLQFSPLIVPSIYKANSHLVPHKPVSTAFITRPYLIALHKLLLAPLSLRQPGDGEMNCSYITFFTHFIPTIFFSNASKIFQSTFPVLQADIALKQIFLLVTVLLDWTSSSWCHF